MQICALRAKEKFAPAAAVGMEDANLAAALGALDGFVADQAQDGSVLLAHDGPAFSY